MIHRIKIIGAAFAALIVAAGTAHAGDPAFGSNSLTAKPSVQMSNMTMTVSGPDGYYIKKHSSYGSPYMSLAKNGGMADGVYKWELTGSTSQRENANPMGLDYGRGDKQRQFVNKSMTESGTFRVVNGVIVAPDASMTEDKAPRKRPTTPFHHK